MKKRIKKIIQGIFKIFGYKISNLNAQTIVFKHSTTHTMKEAIKRCVSRGLNVNTVIDVGASDGRWSRDCLNSIPNANYLLIEAQKAHEEGIVKFKNECSNVEYVIAAAGIEDGNIYFDNSGLFGGVASKSKLEKNCIEVQMVSIDNEVKRRNLKPPYVIKLDTHGFEIPILEGAKDVLKQAELVIIETYNYKLTNESLKYYEMCSYMEKLGFFSIEMVDLMLREYDNSFWQMDTFFVPSTNKEFSYNSYK